MNLSVNDIFDSKDEIIKAMKDFADQNNIKYDLQETPKTISLFCQGKEKFGCDCFITSNYRKKDNKFIVKKMKLIHKCPTSVTDFGSTDDFIKNEIYRTIGDAEVRIGDIVSILHNRGIKVSYNSVWNAMRKKENDYEEDRKKESDYYEEKENGEQKKSYEEEEVKRMKVVDRKMDSINEDRNNGGIKYKGNHNLNAKDHNGNHKDLHDNNNHNGNNNNITSKKDKYKPLDDSKFKSNFFEDSEILNWDDLDFKKFHDSNEIIAEYAKEFVDINSDKISVHFYGKLFFYYVPEYSKVLFPVCEIKFYKRKNGIVIYGLLYDPLFEPVVYSCLISEDIDDILAFKFFIRSHPKIFFMVEYDDILIEILEECKVDFFIKTRDICNFIYSLDNNKENIENIWNNCNFGNEIIKELGKVNPKRYLKQKLDLEILNINNLPECDVDFIMYSVYSLNYFDCINAIHKLSNDSIKNRKRFTITDTKSLFGNNVITRIERNMNYEFISGGSNYGSSNLNNGSGNLNNGSNNNMNINNIMVKKVDLINQICDCGKFQELMIPCVHACIKIKEEKGDPYNYVSTVYSKEQYNKLIEIIPVLNISLKLHSDKVQIRKGPGRPKKFSIREVDVM